MLDVKIKGFAELQKALDELPGKLERNIMRGALRAGAKVFEAGAKRRVPVRSGKTKKAIRVSVKVVKGRIVATIRAGGQIPVWLEMGTNAHFIKAKKAESLSFGGTAREGVEHPGSQKHPFMRPTLDADAPAALLATGNYIKKRLTVQGINTPDIDVLDES